MCRYIGNQSLTPVTSLHTKYIMYVCMQKKSPKHLLDKLCKLYLLCILFSTNPTKRPKTTIDWTDYNIINNVILITSWTFAAGWIRQYTTLMSGKKYCFSINAVVNPIFCVAILWFFIHALCESNDLSQEIFWIASGNLI